MVCEAKTAYFDQNAAAPWAAAEYGPDKMRKLERLFKHLNKAACSSASGSPEYHIPVGV